MRNVRFSLISKHVLLCINTFQHNNRPGPRAPGHCRGSSVIASTTIVVDYSHLQDELHLVSYTASQDTTTAAVTHTGDTGGRGTEIFTFTVYTHNVHTRYSPGRCVFPLQPTRPQSVRLDMCGRNVVFYQLWLSHSWPSSGHLGSAELCYYDTVSQLESVSVVDSCLVE